MQSNCQISNFFFVLPIKFFYVYYQLCNTWTSSMAVSASSLSTDFESLALAWAVDRRIKVSRARAVTGWVRAKSEFSKSWDRNFEYSSPISSQASSVKTERNQITSITKTRIYNSLHLCYSSIKYKSISLDCSTKMIKSAPKHKR